MSITTISARAFARDLAGAKRAAAAGPVFITDRGAPKYVLMTVEEYFRSRTGKSEPTLLEAMQALPRSHPSEFEAPRLTADFQQEIVNDGDF